MRRLPIVAGNWKLHTTRAEARMLLRDLRTELDRVGDVEVVLCPPSPWLADAADLLAGSTLAVGVQNVYWEPQGAFTGEVSAAQLTGVADYAIVGHSERRRLFRERPTETNRKLRATVEAGLRPILAVGERLTDATSRQTEAVLQRQLVQALRGFRALPPTLVVAYEPVWAIGTGAAASPQDAQDRCALVRSILAERFDAASAATCRIQYGGSVNAENAEGFASQPDIDGLLVGGASLDARAFAAICRIVAAT